MKRNRRSQTTELELLIDKKQRLLRARRDNLDTISGHTIDTSKLIEAKRIAEKLDKGDYTGKDEINKLNDVKEKYESFLDDPNITDKKGLEEALSYTRDEKECYINKDHKLLEQTTKLQKEIKESKGSLIDDYADLRTEMSDYMDYD